MRLFAAAAALIALVLIAFAAHGATVTLQIDHGATLSISSPSSSPTPPAVDYCPSPDPTIPVAGCGLGAP